MIDRKFAIARQWSNRELRTFAPLFAGSVANVSAWRDEDKEGGHYESYFTNATKYVRTNFRSDAMGFQGTEGEIFLDLTTELEPSLHGKFDVVFNHTTLEHIYEVHKAFANLCLLSKDTVIVVVPFLQQMHADYGDFWRFTPLTLRRMFEENGMDMLYVSYNNERHASVYLFAIGVRDVGKWNGKIPRRFAYDAKTDSLDLLPPLVGCRAVTNSLLYRIRNYPWKSLMSGKKQPRGEHGKKERGTR